MAITDMPRSSAGPEEMGPGTGVADRIGVTDDSDAQTRNVNGSTINAAPASGAADRDVKDRAEDGPRVYTAEDLRAETVVEDVEPAPAGRNRLFGDPGSRARRVAAIVAISATAVVGGVTAATAYAVSRRSSGTTISGQPTTGPYAPGAPGNPSPEVTASPETGKLDFTKMTEKEAGELSLDQIKQAVIDLGWANFVALPGYTDLDPKNYTGSDLFNYYHNGLTSWLVFHDDGDLQRTLDETGGCAALHLVAHGMDPAWYAAHTALIRAQGSVPLPDDGEVPVDDPGNTVVKLPDGSLLAKTEYGSRRSVFQKNQAYFLLFPTVMNKEAQGSQGYYTLRISAEDYARLAKTATTG